MYSLIIKHGKVIDGTGAAGAVMDVAVEGGEIVNIAPNITTRAATIIDAGGKIVCPGFVDIQNHSDSYWQLFENPRLDSMLMQGYTSILVGQCGASLAPLVGSNAMEPLRRWRDNLGANVDWRTFAEFAKVMTARPFGCNVGSLVGFDMAKGDLKLLEQSLDEGAFGVSYRLGGGGSQASALEFSQAGAVVAKAGGLLSVHIENEEEGLAAAVERCLELASAAKVKLKISHFKVRGAEHWKQFEHIVELLETARQRGTSVYADVYPYDSTWQSLYHYLPTWVNLESGGGLDSVLNNPADKNKLLNYLAQRVTDARGLIISSTANQLNVAGKTVAEGAKNLGVSSEVAILEILRTGGAEVLVFDRNLNSTQVWNLAVHPLTMIVTDGGGFTLPAGSNQGRLVHPRCFGAAPSFIRDVLDRSAVTLEEAIRKLTSLPARVMGLPKRGELRVGNRADVVVFDPALIAGRATLTNPQQFPSGIDCVLVNGELVVFKGVLTGAQPGRFLRKR